MKKLTQVGVNRAKDYLFSQARPLEKALFELEFGEGSIDDVLTQLAAFQNSDGGFGRALEPDMRTPSSSALCTEIGLRMLTELNVPSAHPMLKSAVQYVLATLNPDTQVWRVVPWDANDYPHAPWWHEENDSVARAFDNFRLTPRAGILGALWIYANLTPAGWLDQITEETVKAAEQTSNTEFGSGGDAFVYAQRLAEAPVLPDSYKSRLKSRLREAVDAVVTRDPAKWASYCTPPLKIAPSPQSLTADILAADVQVHLDYLVEHQSPVGNWEPNWSWFGSYPEAWDQAKLEWRGVLTMEALLSLRAYRRMER